MDSGKVSLEAKKKGKSLKVLFFFQIKFQKFSRIYSRVFLQASVVFFLLSEILKRLLIPGSKSCSNSPVDTSNCLHSKPYTMNSLLHRFN
jgi:hypothetical protein